MGEDRKVYKTLVVNPEGKRPLESIRRRWEDGMRMNLGETGWGKCRLDPLAQDRDRWLSLVNTVMNLRVLEPRSYLAGFCYGSNASGYN
jgi:hypothetical protein